MSYKVASSTTRIWMLVSPRRRIPWLASFIEYLSMLGLPQNGQHKNKPIRISWDRGTYSKSRHPEFFAMRGAASTTWAHMLRIYSRYCVAKDSCQTISTNPLTSLLLPFSLACPRCGITRVPMAKGPLSTMRSVTLQATPCTWLLQTFCFSLNRT